jgi:hypothetical protein
MAEIASPKLARAGAQRRNRHQMRRASTVPAAIATIRPRPSSSATRIN